VQANKDNLLLNPFEKTLTNCNQKGLSENAQKKLAFLCVEQPDSSVDVFMVAVLTVLCFGFCCCCGSFFLFCKYRAKQNNAIEDPNLMAENRQHDPLAAQRILEQ